MQTFFRWEGRMVMFNQSEQVGTVPSSASRDEPFTFSIDTFVFKS